MAIIPLREIRNTDSEGQGEQHKKYSAELAVKILITFAIASAFVLVIVFELDNSMLNLVNPNSGFAMYICKANILLYSALYCIIPCWPTDLLMAAINTWNSIDRGSAQGHSRA